MAFEDDVVRDVLTLFGSLVSDNGIVAPAALLQTDPPHHLWEGLNHYLFVRAKIRENDEELRRQQEKNNHG